MMIGFYHPIQKELIKHPTKMDPIPEQIFYKSPSSTKVFTKKYFLKSNVVVTPPQNKKIIITWSNQIQLNVTI